MSFLGQLGCVGTRYRESVDLGMKVRDGWILDRLGCWRWIEGRVTGICKLDHLVPRVTKIDQPLLQPQVLRVRSEGRSSFHRK